MYFYNQVVKNMKIRNIILYILFLCTSRVFAQNKDSLANVIKNRFEKAETELKNGRKVNSLMRYYSIDFIADKYQLNDSVTEHLRTISIKKIDSLLPVIINEKSSQWKGRWKLTQLKKNEYFSYQYIEITDDKILFYDDSLNIPSRVEDIKSPSYEYFYSSFKREDFNSVEFKNGEIWRFDWHGEASTGGGKIKWFLFPFIRRLEDGTIQQNPTSSKKEHRTYYTLIE